MVQGPGVINLFCKCENLGSDPQNPWKKPGTVVYSYTPGAGRVRWESETGGSLGSLYRPASIAHVAKILGRWRTLSQAKCASVQNSWRLTPEFALTSLYALCVCVCAHTPTHLCIHTHDFFIVQSLDSPTRLYHFTSIMIHAYLHLSDLRQFTEHSIPWYIKQYTLPYISITSMCVTD